LAEVGTDLEQEQTQQLESQPARSRTLKRTGLALMALGLVGSVLVVGTVHDKMLVADVKDVTQQWGKPWGFGGMWDSVKDAVGDTVKDHVKGIPGRLVDKVNDHANGIVDSVQDHVKGIGDIDILKSAQDHANNLGDKINHVKDQASNLDNVVGHIVGGKINDIKDHVSDLRSAVVKPVCDAIKKALPDLKFRWVQKMHDDLMDKRSACGKDFKGEACTQSFVNDACPMPDGLRKKLCEEIFLDVVKKIQSHIPRFVMTTQQHLSEGGLIKNSLNMEMPNLDIKIKEVCG